MTTNKVASSVIATGPKDELVAADAKGKTPQTTLARLSNALTNVSEGIAANARQSNMKPGDLANVTKIEDGKPTVAPKEALSRLDQISGVSVTALTGQNADLRDNAALNLVKLTKDEELTSISNDAGNVLRIGRNTKTSSAKSLADAVSKFSKVPGLATFADQHAEVALGLSYLDKAIALGIPDLIDNLMAKIKDDKRKRQLLIENVRGVILRGDIDTLNKILDWVGSEGVLARCPDAIPLLLASYRLPPKTEPKSHGGLRAALLATLVRIDSNWDKTSRGSELVTNLDVFTYASRDVVTLLNFMSDDYIVPLSIAPSYRNTSLIGLAKRYYPQIALWEGGR